MLPAPEVLYLQRMLWYVSSGDTMSVRDYTTITYTNALNVVLVIAAESVHERFYFAVVVMIVF